MPQVPLQVMSSDFHSTLCASVTNLEFVYSRAVTTAPSIEFAQSFRRDAVVHGGCGRLTESPLHLELAGCAAIVRYWHLAVAGDAQRSPLHLELAGFAAIIRYWHLAVAGDSQSRPYIWNWRDAPRSFAIGIWRLRATQWVAPTEFDVEGARRCRRNWRYLLGLSLHFQLQSAYT